MQPVDELDAQLGKGWEDRSLAIYRKGGSDHEVARALNMTMAVFDRMYQAYATFEEVVNKGRSDARAWFEELGRNGLIKANGDLNHQLWTIIMKSRYGMSDGTEGDTTNKPAALMSESELEQKIAAKIKKALPIVASRNPD